MYNIDHQPAILYFHSVAPRKNQQWFRSYLTLELKYFENLLCFIKKKNFKTFFISEMAQNGCKVGKAIYLSFDDGYLDNWVYAFPLLKKYGIKATIFCSTDYIDGNEVCRPTLEDVWNGKLKQSELTPWGFCSVCELREMERSGLIDIQSHTVTHDKLPVSGLIIGFHHSGNRNLNFIFPENSNMKPGYITHGRLVESVSYGRPLFEEKSAVLAPRVWINEGFIQAVIHRLKGFDWKTYHFQKALAHVRPVIQSYQEKDQIITRRETEVAYRERVENEVLGSKQALEQMLKKNISVICWPHGDFNPLAVEMARNVGYEKIHYVETKKNGVPPGVDLFTRIGVRSVLNSRFLTQLKIKTKIYTHQGKFPYPQLSTLYRSFK